MKKKHTNVVFSLFACLARLYAVFVVALLLLLLLADLSVLSSKQCGARGCYIIIILFSRIVVGLDWLCELCLLSVASVSVFTRNKLFSNCYNFFVLLRSSPSSSFVVSTFVVVDVVVIPCSYVLALILVL